jgi:glycosyltransferase involved in cell wall biosynthesis
VRVLHINDYSSGGGAEVHISATMDLLRADGIEVDLFTSEHVPSHRMTAKRYINNRICRQALRTRLREFRPDVAHLHNFYHVLSPGILSELDSHRREHDHAMHVVMTAHDYHLVCPNSGGSWFKQRGRASQPIDSARMRSSGYLLTRRWDHRGVTYSSLKLAQHIWNYRLLQRQRSIDMVICPSRFIQRLIRASGIRTMYLPHAAPHLTSNNLTARGVELRLAFAGRVEPEKGLVEFFRMLPVDFAGSLIIIGEGHALNACKTVVQQRGLGKIVRFMGRLPHEQTMTAIAECHVLVLPSLCLENCPMSLVEALAVGTNILTCDMGGMAEIVHAAGVGYVFAPGDQHSLKSALDSIIQAHQTRRLNDFDVTRFLSERSERAYLDGLLQAYDRTFNGVLSGAA